MRYTGLLALGLGNLAHAQMMNSTFTPPTPTPTGDDGAEATLVPNIGAFVFYGCTTSDQGHLSFSLVVSSGSMSVGLCAASCPTRFMGVNGRDCFCGDEAGDDINIVDSDVCDTVCPGDDSEFCGGIVNPLRMIRRQAVPVTDALSTYIRVDAGDNGNGNGNGNSGDNNGNGNGSNNGNGSGNGNNNGNDSGNNNGNNNGNDSGNNNGNNSGNNNGNTNNYYYGNGGITGGPEPTETITTTITSTGTITSCPPENPDCPIGEVTVATITSTFCPEPEPTHHAYPKKAILCYGDYCIPQLPECHGPDCTQHRVVCRDETCYPEECKKGEEQYANKLVICEGEECSYSKCEGEDCNKKIVCYGEECLREKCYGEECNKKVVQKNQECSFEECEGEECHTEEICEGEECHPAPVCGEEGAEECPVPSRPGPIPCIGEECREKKPAASPTPAPPAGGEEEQEVPEGSGSGAPGSPPVAGSDKQLPALGMGLFAGIVGIAFFL